MRQERMRDAVIFPLQAWVFRILLLVPRKVPHFIASLWRPKLISDRDKVEH